MSAWIIYGLCDPADGIIRYIGATRSPKQRTYYHLYDAKRNKRPISLWILDLLASGVQPSMVVLEEATELSWQESEARWIADLRNRGFDLLNICAGGRGTIGYQFTDEVKSRMSKARLGMSFTQEHREKISKALKGRVFSEESRKKMSETQKRRPHQPQTEAWIASRKGKKLPQAWRDAISAGHKKRHEQRRLLNAK